MHPQLPEYYWNALTEEERMEWNHPNTVYETKVALRKVAALRVDLAHLRAEYAKLPDCGEPIPGQSPCILKKHHSGRCL